MFSGCSPVSWRSWRGQQDDARERRLARVVGVGDAAELAHSSKSVSSPGSNSAPDRVEGGAPGAVGDQHRHAVRRGHAGRHAPRVRLVRSLAPPSTTCAPAAATSAHAAGVRRS